MASGDGGRSYQVRYGQTVRVPGLSLDGVCMSKSVYQIDTLLLTRPSLLP